MAFWVCISIYRFENYIVLKINKLTNLLIKNIGSYKNSKHNIEPELIKIMTENSILEYILSNCNNDFLYFFLNIIEPRKSVSSLTMLNNFVSDKYQNFIRFPLVEKEL